MSKNGFRLNKKRSKSKYDWWWHSFVGRHSVTNELKPFFIEYYIINPGLWKGDIIWGQTEENKNAKKKPCYAMIKAGSWGEDKSQLHNFYSVCDFEASKNKLECIIAHNSLSETQLKGFVEVSEEERDEFPERMSDAGSMKWDLSIDKIVSYDVGYGSSEIANKLNLFHMYWHVEGMKSKLSGEVIYNGEKYIVEPDTSYGYQDKNWGKDYTNPWIWLNCNNLYSSKNKKAVDASLDIGGGCPKVLGIPLKRRILTAFYYEGELMEFNFSKFWKFSKQSFHSTEDDKYIHWNVISENKGNKIEVDFKCEKSKMLLVNYENPKGEKLHNKLWNGGHAEGTIKFYRKKNNKFELIDELIGNLGGCEYGEYSNTIKKPSL